jgi:hypothetical protein
MGDVADRARLLFRGAREAGELSAGASEALRQLPDITDRVGHGLASRSAGDEVLLVSVLVDDTISISDRAPVVIRGHNRMIQAATRVSDTTVWFSTHLMTGSLLAPYTPVTEAPRLSSENYRAIGDHTPLYQETLHTLGLVFAQARELREAGVRVRTFTLILTDGDNNSGNANAEAVRYMVTDMLEFAPDPHIISAMGIGDRDFFRSVFRQMGIREGWILTARSTDKEIDDLFTRVIEPTLRLAATSAAAFAQLESGPVGS